MACIFKMDLSMFHFAVWPVIYCRGSEFLQAEIIIRNSSIAISGFTELGSPLGYKCMACGCVWCNALVIFWQGDGAAQVMYT